LATEILVANPYLASLTPLSINRLSVNNITDDST